MDVCTLTQSTSFALSIKRGTFQRAPRKEEDPVSLTPCCKQSGPEGEGLSTFLPEQSFCVLYNKDACFAYEIKLEQIFM